MPASGQPVDRPLLERAQVAAAVVPARVGRRPVVLQVDLDPLAVLGEQVQQRVVAGDAHPVGVDQDADDVARGHLAQQLRQLRVERRLAAGEHQHVDAAVLPGQPGVEARQHVGQRRDPVSVRRRVGEAGGAAQVALGR